MIPRLDPAPAEVRVLDVGIEEFRRAAVSAGVVVTPTLLVRGPRGRDVAISLELSDARVLLARLRREMRLSEVRPAPAELPSPAGAP